MFSATQQPRSDNINATRDWEGVGVDSPWYGLVMGIPSPLQAAYDQWLRAKHRAKVRHEELNAKRRKLKESKLRLMYNITHISGYTTALENKESQHVQHVEDEREAARLMQKEVQD